CFKKKRPPLHYFSQAKAWSDQRVFAVWFGRVLLPHVRRLTAKKVLLIMDNCTGHGELADPCGQVKVICLPPNCTAVHQPMDQGIIAALKLRFRTGLLYKKVATLAARGALRAAAKAMKMPAGPMGLAEGYDPHLLDAMELMKAAWGAMEEGSVARCWLKADILPLAMQAELQSLHGRGAAAGAAAPAVADLEAAIRTLRIRGTEAEDEDIAEALALHVGYGASSAAAAAAVAQRWVQLEEEDDVAAALRSDLRGELVAAAAAATVAEAAAAAAAAAAEAADSDDEGGSGDPMDSPDPSQGSDSQNFEPLPPYSVSAKA
ncbi:unnamed protein product, partial [Phaeothamnion confervicola]